MRFKSTSTLVVIAVLTCAGVAAAASVGMGRQSKDGSVGLQGGPSPAALGGVQVVQSASVTIPAGSSASVSAYCPSGKIVIGTGFYSSITTVGFVKAYGTFTGGAFWNNSSISTSVHVQAICASDTTGLLPHSDSAEFERDVRQITEQWQLGKLGAQ